MKSFISWFVLLIILSALLFGATHLYYSAYPRKYLIAFDDSFEMNNLWPGVSELLSSIKNTPYTQFMLLSNKEKITPTWTATPDWSFFDNKRVFIGSYRVKDLVNNNKYEEINEADRIFLITPGKIPEEILLDKRVRVMIND